LKKPAAFALLIVLLIILLAAASVVGSVKIPPGEIMSIIRGGGDDTYRRVLLGIRVPRIVQAAVVGMGLSVSGAFLQGLLGNPLADPYILGISSGAALGAAVSIVLGLGTLGTQAFAFIAALATIYLVISLSRLGPGTGGTTLLLSGIAVSTFLSAILSFIMLISHQQMSGIVFWMMGDFSLISWNEVFQGTKRNNNGPGNRRTPGCKHRKGIWYNTGLWLPCNRSRGCGKWNRRICGAYGTPHYPHVCWAGQPGAGTLFSTNRCYIPGVCRCTVPYANSARRNTHRNNNRGVRRPVLFVYTKDKQNSKVKDDW